ncbi:hypothetical protein [Massilia sp. TWR1-2-2]|uniref:hypothetical protein n=1 Tax=Massilia sp. TWR1-2-2 TaxID=2804584 RepID=UPI003CEF14D5
MNRFLRLLACLALLSLGAVSSLASATNYSLWINGRGAGGVVGNYDNFAYWGPAAVEAGVNKKAVNWDGYNSIATQNGKIRDALDCFCTGANWCYIASQSAGDLMIGYTLANYGGSTRMKKNAAPNAAGVCGNADGTAQTGWNIKWVLAAAGAAGGTELADAGAWTTGEPLVRDLRTSTARAMYNHNDTRFVWFYMFAGAYGTVYSGLLPGQDDEVVPYHSAGAVSGTAGSAYCNPRDWWCNDLTIGSAVNEGGWPKWSYHYVLFRDDEEAYSHSNRGNWAGIVSVMRSTMVVSAR